VEVWGARGSEVLEGGSDVVDVEVGDPWKSDIMKV
jgi:hypothetical protein